MSGDGGNYRKLYMKNDKEIDKKDGEYKYK